MFDNWSTIFILVVNWLGLVRTVLADHACQGFKKRVLNLISKKTFQQTFMNRMLSFRGIASKP